MRKSPHGAKDDAFSMLSLSQGHCYHEYGGSDAYLNLFVKLPVAVVVKSRSGALLRSAY